MKPLVSVVVPMHNEEENAEHTLDALAGALAGRGWTYELIPVNDGSTDGTGAELARLAAGDGRIRPVSYDANRGRGFALRQGFSKASGTYIASMDADLSYTADTAVRMVSTLIEDPDADLVLASPYMPGGAVEGVPFVRLALSKAGNWVLRRTMAEPIYTSTGIVRAYRAEVIKSLDPESDGKEIHLEILSECLALGYRVIEIPAVLSTRRKGSSKFRPKATMLSHLAFTMLERSAVIFALGGLLLFLIGVLVGGYLLSQYFGGDLNPERPLMTVMVLLFIGGAVGLSFALVAVQMLELRRNIVRTQAEVLRMHADVLRLLESREAGDE
jgi:glycosyltransferase involved in cell wall biosynthesis